MLYNQTFNLDQVAFAAEGLKDAQQTVSPLVFMFLCYNHVYSGKEEISFFICLIIITQNLAWIIT